MTYLYMAVMWLCHFPTLHHNDIFPPGGNMTGGNMLVGHDNDDDKHRWIPDVDAKESFSCGDEHHHHHHKLALCHIDPAKLMIKYQDNIQDMIRLWSGLCHVDPPKLMKSWSGQLWLIYFKYIYFPQYQINQRNDVDCWWCWILVDLPPGCSRGLIYYHTLYIIF